MEENNKPLTLGDLKSDASSVTAEQKQNFVKVNIDEIAPAKPSREAVAAAANQTEMLNSLDSAISRTIKETNAIREAVLEEKMMNPDDPYWKSAEEEAYDATNKKAVDAMSTTENEIAYDSDDKLEDDYTTIKEEAILPPSSNNTTSNSGVSSIDEDDLMYLMDDDEEKEEPAEEESESDEILRNRSQRELAKEIRTQISPVSNVVDLSAYKITTKAISISKVLSSNTNTVHTSEWVMYSAGRPIVFSALSGPELDKFDTRGMNARNSIRVFTEMYTVLYNHLIDANKPSSMEAWVKTINFADFDDIIFAAYKASFETSNFVPYECPKCKKTLMNKNDILNMVKFTSEEVKENFKKIISKDTTSNGDEYESTLIQVSDTYAISVRMPTVYSSVFETATLDTDFVTKYADMIGLMSHIDNIYYINRETMGLEPINTMPDAKNITKTVKHKIIAWYRVLNTLTSDQHSALIGAITKFEGKYANAIKYIIPATTCPHCGQKIDESEQDPLSMLFTRHRLVLLATTSQE